MSWKFGGLIVKNYKIADQKQLLQKLGLSKTEKGNEISFLQAIALKNGETTITTIENGFLIINNRMPYDCSFEPGQTTPFENKVKELSIKCSVLIFFLDGNSGTYGLIYFLNGECIRKWAMDSEGILCNEGEVLDAEIPFVTGQQEPDGEGRVLEVLEEEGVTLSKLNREEIHFDVFF